MTPPFEILIMTDHATRAKEILNDLVEYTGKPSSLVAARCKYAMVELAWHWGKETTLDFYRNTDLYIFDLTTYQSQIVPQVDIMVQEINNRGIKKILDLGGGIGEYTIRVLQETKAEVTFLELKDSQTLKYAEHRFKKYGLKPKIVNEDYEWQKEEWDAVIAMDVIEHMEQDVAEKTIEGLNKKARYVFSNPDAIQFNQYYPQHITDFKLEQFRHIDVNLYQNRTLK